MSLLSGLTTDKNIADEKDSVGGSRVRESGLYPLTIALAYLTKSAGGALALNLVLKDDDGEVRQQLWVTNKKGENFYLDKKQEKQYLPGFNMANSLALLTVGKEIAALDTEEKVINLYNFEAKADVPTKVDMVVELLGKEILVGLLKQTVDKTKKNEATGEYEPTGETREENEVDKFFRAEDRLTSSEIRAGATEAAFATTWETKWKDKTRDRSTGAKGGNGTAGAPKASGPATSQPTQSLFKRDPQ